MCEVYRSGARGGARLTAALGDPALEALHPATGVDQLLAPGVERMARCADLHVDLGLRRARGELVAARAGDVGFDVFGMDFGLHDGIDSSGVMSVSSWPDRRGAGGR